MRLWLSLVTILVLLLCINGNHIPLEPCPDNKVCLIFGDDVCTVNSVQTGAYVWQKDKTRTNCQNENYGYVYARLDILPYTPSKWKILATFYEKYKQDIGQKLEDLVFNFGNAKMEFPSKEKMKFSWNGEASEHAMTSEGTFTSIDSSQTVSFTFGKYSFEIGANGKKMIDFIGPNVTLDYEGVVARRGMIGDLPAQLDKLTSCDPFDIRHVYQGTEDKLYLFEPKIAACTSKMWFSKNVTLGEWKETNRLECTLGHWTFAADGGTHKVDSSLVFQCSAAKPDPPMTTTTLASPTTPPPSSARVGVIIGGAIGGVAGLIVVVVAVFFLVRFCRRREGDKKTTTKGASSIRIRDVPSRRVDGARTPNDKIAEYTAQTDFEGLKTEILEETTATAKLSEDVGSPIGTARPSPVPTPSPAGTPSVVAVATAEITPTI